MGHILVDYSKSGGLVFNWKKKSGGKFFQIRIGKTESFLDAPKKTFLQCYVYKSSPNYQHAEILKLIPAQSLHSSWMFYCVIRNIEDFNILLKSELIDKGIECIDKNFKYSQSNLKTNKELKPIFIEDIRKVREQNFEF